MTEGQSQLWRLVGSTLIEWMDAAVDQVRQNEETLNRLNVFPVADRDTGHNMLATLEGALAAMRQGDSRALARVVQRMVDGALVQARGNSGVILSQWLAGFSEAVQARSSLDAADLKRAFQSAARRARQQVASPVEGTILTVADALAEAARADEDLGQCLETALAGADSALSRTPLELPALAGEDLVDAGALGLVLIVRGFLSAAQGKRLAAASPKPAVAGALPAFRSPLTANYYDVEALLYHFLVSDPVGVLRQRLAEVGESIVIAPGVDLVKIHVHTDRLVELVEMLTAVGAIRQLECLDMRCQVEEHDGAAPVVVVVEDALQPLFESEWPVLSPSLAQDRPGTVWVETARPVEQGLAISSLGLAGQLLLDFVPSAPWAEERQRLEHRLQAMKSWLVTRERGGWRAQGIAYPTPETLADAFKRSVGALGVITVYLSAEATRREAVLWQDALGAELVQVPRNHPWLEIVWQP